MANFSSLKQAIQNYIKENGNKEITGNLLQEILLSMVVTMGDNAINSLTTVVNELNTILHSVDAEPTKNSVNLVRSGGVWSGINREALRAFNAETFEARFNSTNNRVEFFNQSGDMLYWYDASAFVVSGLVVDVYIDGDNLVFVIDTQDGEKTIEVPLTDIFNPNNYYTKTQIDGIVRAIRELYDGAEYRGFITPSSQAESKQGVKMVCFATEAGTYTNFLANYDTPIEIPVRGIWVFERGVDADDWTAYSLLEIDKVYAPAQASGMGRVVLQKNMVNGVNTLTQSMINKISTRYIIQYDFNIESTPENISLNFASSNVSGIMTPEKAELDAATAAYNDNPTQANLKRKQKAQAAYEAIGSQDYYYWTSYTIPAQHCLHLTGRAFRLNDSKNAQVATEYNQGIIYAPSNESLTVYIGNLAGQYSYLKDGYVRVPANCVLEFDGGSLLGVCTVTGTNTGIQAGLVKIFGSDVNFAGTWKNDFSLTWCGCTNDEADATTNTAIINKLLSVATIKDFVVETIIPINGSINLTRGEFRLKGTKVRTQCGFSVISNNTPCFAYHFANSSSPKLSSNIFFDTFCIKYKTWQHDYSDSICFKFSADTHYSWGWLQMYFNNLYIENAYGVVTNLVEPIWDTYWTDIYCYNIAGYFWNTTVNGQLQNVFKNVSVLNYGHRTYNETTKDTNVVGQLFKVTGECYFENLDIEDWYGQILYSPDGTMEIKNSHFERNCLAGSYLSFFVSNANFTFTSNVLYENYIAYDVNPDIPRSIFSGITLRAIVNNNQYDIRNNSNALYGVFNYVISTLGAAKNNKLITDYFTSLSSDFGVYTRQCNHIIVNGVKLLTTLEFNDTTINDIKYIEKGDTTNYNGKRVYAKCESSTDVTVYQGESASYGMILTVTAEVASHFKGNDYIVIDGINHVYKIIGISDSGNNKILNLDGYISSGVRTYDFRHVQPKECLYYVDNDKPITADIQTSGTFANRPVNGVIKGDSYFCTDKQTTEGAADGIMIYYKGNDVWVDALGRVVS